VESVVGLHYKGLLLSLPANIRHGGGGRGEVTGSDKLISIILYRCNYDRKKFYGTDPAYFATMSVTKKKSLIMLTQGRTNEFRK
jgi:hypothetical protein